MAASTVETAPSRHRRSPRLTPGRAALLVLLLSAVIVGGILASSADLDDVILARGFHGFGGGVIPGAGWRPYARSSPFNQTVAGARVVPRSAAIVSTVLRDFGPPAPLVVGNAGTPTDYGHPTFYAAPGDPLVTLRPAAGAIGSALNGLRIPIPADARPAGGTDGHMAVVTPDGWEYDFWQAHRAGEQLDFNGGGRTRVDGSGLGSGATAGLFANLAGIIRAPELISGRIDHALFIVLRCTSNSTSFGYGTRASAAHTADGSYVYPAEHGGTACASNPDLPPLGTRFMLAMTSAQIQSLDVPTWRKTVLTALATYGGYVGDTGGPGFGVMFESDLTYTALGRPDPLVAFARENHVPARDGTYVFNLSKGVDWARDLRVVAPPAH